MGTIVVAPSEKFRQRSVPVHGPRRLPRVIVRAGYVWNMTPIGRQEWEAARPAAWAIIQAMPYVPSQLLYRMRNGNQRLAFRLAREAAASGTAAYMRGDLDVAWEVTRQVRDVCATLGRHALVLGA